MLPEKVPPNPEKLAHGVKHRFQDPHFTLDRLKKSPEVGKKCQKCISESIKNSNFSFKNIIFSLKSNIFHRNYLKIP